MKTQDNEKKKTTQVPPMRCPIYRHLYPELTDKEFIAMRMVVCGWLFQRGLAPEA